MSLIEEEAELRLGQVADFGKHREQLREQPQQERGIEPRILHQLVGGENVDVAAAVAIGADEVRQRQRGLAEEIVAALVLQHEQLALDGADGRLRHVAVLHRELGSVIGDVGEHRAQILEIEDRKPLLVGDAEADVEHALLHLVEVHQPREQQWPHLGDGGAHRVTLSAEQVPEDHRELIGLVGEAERLGAADESLLGLAALRDPRKIALDVGGKDRHTGAREALRQHLQGHRLSGAGCAGHQPVPVGERERQIFGLCALAYEDLSVLVDLCHCRASWPQSRPSITCDYSRRLAGAVNRRACGRGARCRPARPERARLSQIDRPHSASLSCTPCTTRERDAIHVRHHS